MQAKPKSNSIVTHALNADGSITFAVLGVGALQFRPHMVAEANRRRAEYHGWIQRIVDAAAIGVTDSEGNVIPRDQRTRMKYHAMNEIIVHYESGSEEWSRVGTGGGQKSITIEAIARVLDIEYAEALEYVDRHAEKKYAGDTKKCLAELRKGKRIMSAMEDIRRERTPEPKVDADAELEELKAA